MSTFDAMVEVARWKRRLIEAQKALSLAKDQAEARDRRVKERLERACCVAVARARAHCAKELAKLRDKAPGPTSRIAQCEHEIEWATRRLAEAEAEHKRLWDILRAAELTPTA